MTGRGYRSEPPRPGVQLLCTKRGHSLGVFLPYVDYVSFHDAQSEALSDESAVLRAHEADRQQAGRSFRLPRLLRYTVPNVVTVVVTGPGGPGELAACARRPRPRRDWRGGETHSLCVLDVERGRLYSQGLEATGTRYGGVTTTSVNPTNRVTRLLEELAASFSPGAAPAGV